MTLFQYRKSFLSISLVALAAILFSLVGLVKADTLVEECDGSDCILFCYFEEGGGIGSSDYAYITSICDVEEEEEEEPVVAAAPLTPELCITSGTRIAVDGGKLLIFSDFVDTTNGMIISHIPLSSLRAPTDEEKASDLPIWLTYKDSEFAPGWAVAVYWQNDHYGVVVYKDNGKTLYEDTGAICGWF